MILMNDKGSVFIDINKIWDDSFVKNSVISFISAFKANDKVSQELPKINKNGEKPHDNFIFFIVSNEGSKKGLNQFKSLSEIFESLTQADPSPSKSASKGILQGYIKANFRSHEEYLSAFYVSRGQFNKNGLMVTDILPLDQW